MQTKYTLFNVFPMDANNIALVKQCNAKNVNLCRMLGGGWTLMYLAPHTHSTESERGIKRKKSHRNDVLMFIHCRCLMNGILMHFSASPFAQKKNFFYMLASSYRCDNVNIMREKKYHSYSSFMYFNMQYLPYAWNNKDISHT